MATIETRRSAKGTTTYRVKIRLEGHSPADRSFTRLSAAKDWARLIESQMRDGTYAAGSGKTVAEAIDAFLAEELTDKKDQRMLAARLRWWRAQLGAIRLRDLTAWHIYPDSAETRRKCLPSAAEAILLDR